jgi:hypothetical protein
MEGESLARWHQVDQVLGPALDLPVGQRRAFLDRACGSDAALRAEVDTLLDACE